MNNFFTVLEKRVLTPAAFVLRFEKKNIEFKAGQYLSVGLANEEQARDYSIYSAENDQFIEILVKVVDDGSVSKQLLKCSIGDKLKVSGAKGNFVLKTNNETTKNYLFIATGTGISPFHSHIKSNIGLNYLLIHGVRHAYETYESSQYDPKRYISCTSRDKKGMFHGRTTDYLKTIKVEKNSIAFLCGNGDMIFEAFEILSAKGIPVENIHTEIYF
jgi:ferredoxin--NADP+ reductase/benzoate/toluate 1,2-dioxygenase reductase subunit